MQLMQWGRKWIVYDDDGKVVVITSIKRIAERMMKNGK